MTPEEEDRDLFKTYGGPIEVHLLPNVHKPKKDEFLIRGYFNTSVEIYVSISGRRAQQIAPLITRLREIDSQARRDAAALGKPTPNVNQMRLPAQIKGSWKNSFWRDADGNETRSFQLIAARWAYQSADGALEQYGEAPTITPQPLSQDQQKSYILQVREIDAVPQAGRQASFPE